MGCKRWSGPSGQHSLALIWPVADNVRIRTSSASRRIGLLGTIHHTGADRNVFLGANLWSRFQALNHIQAALNCLDWLWLCIGGPADLQRQGNAAEHKNAAKRKNLDLLTPSELEHRCFGAAPLKWSGLMYGFRHGQGGLPFRHRGGSSINSVRSNRV